jgi:hypothetical protein
MGIPIAKRRCWPLIKCIFIKKREVFQRETPFSILHLQHVFRFLAKFIKNESSHSSALFEFFFIPTGGHSSFPRPFSSPIAERCEPYGYTSSRLPCRRASVVLGRNLAGHKAKHFVLPRWPRSQQRDRRRSFPFTIIDYRYITAWPNHVYEDEPAVRQLHY